jgi:hypothetical protein
MFFHNPKKYDNSSLRFLKSISLTVNNSDYFSVKQKPYTLPTKPKFMNYRLFLDQQLSGFEKFYLKNELFIADSFEFTPPADENLEFFLDKEFASLRTEDLKHYLKVRLPLFGENVNEEIEKKAKAEETKGFEDNSPLVSLFMYLRVFFVLINLISLKSLKIIGGLVVSLIVEEL